MTSARALVHLTCKQPANANYCHVVEPSDRWPRRRGHGTVGRSTGVMATWSALKRGVVAPLARRAAKRATTNLDRRMTTDEDKRRTKAHPRRHTPDPSDQTAKGSN